MTNEEHVDYNRKEVPCKYLMSAPRNFYLFPHKNYNLRSTYWMLKFKCKNTRLRIRNECFSFNVLHVVLGMLFKP